MTLFCLFFLGGFFFLYQKKISVLLWILWVAVGGNFVAVSGLVGSCSRYAPLLTGACKAVTRLIFQPISHSIFIIKKGDNVKGCNESSVITILGFLSAIICKSLVPTLQRKTSKLLF